MRLLFFVVLLQSIDKLSYLYILLEGLLDKADSGTVEIFNETSIKPFSKKAEKILRDKIGYLFQNFALIENESVYDNLSFVLKTGLKKNIWDISIFKTTY